MAQCLILTVLVNIYFHQFSGNFSRHMESFDAIYYEEEIENNEEVSADISLVPDPVVIRGAGNMTV